ncbi:MAG: tRNA (adenosine(37)-N6)-dimethylallyltransferase MiaA [Clostridia bacterium]|nr:tRNA (adenosine(37)-N6)-dimethylallyltransferase MiaA [Clostridia bacterium]
MKKPLAVALVGPTASGKSSLAVKIAKHLTGEVVSADSMQIYKHMDIATAKVTAEEMQGVPHHLIDFVEPWESFSVAEYKALALSCIGDIVRRGKLPVLVGGTGFYVDTVINNTSFLDYEKTDIRKKLLLRAESEGIEALWNELSKVDKESAEKIHKNDLKRIVRALELYSATGKTMTEQRRLSHLEESGYSFCLIGLTAENRQFLYDRIDRRVDLMLKNGLLEEAKSFFELEHSQTAKQAIGYKELKPYFDGVLTLEEATENLKRETRRYAKRQLSWFRRNENINWLYIDKESEETLFIKSLEIIENFIEKAKGESDEENPEL